MADVPHIAFPLRLDADGGLAQVEQDSIEDVRQCVLVLLRTPVGARPLAPDVGVEDPTFTDSHETFAELAAQLEEQEDRARVTITADPIDESGERVLEVEVALATAADAEEDDIA